jgi:hypothetical protein
MHPIRALYWVGGVSRHRCPNIFRHAQASLKGHDPGIPPTVIAVVKLVAARWFGNT